MYQPLRSVFCMNCLMYCPTYKLDTMPMPIVQMRTQRIAAVRYVAQCYPPGQTLIYVIFTMLSMGQTCTSSPG